MGLIARLSMISAAAVLAAGAIGAMGALLALQREPLVAERVAVAAPDVERALQTLRRHDPRRDAPGMARTAVIAAHDIELLLNHGLRRWFAGASVRLLTTPGGARLQASTPAERLPFDAWLNVEMTLRESAGLPVLDGLRIGHLPVPAWLARALLRRAGLRLGLDIDAPWTRELVRHVGLQQHAVAVSYTWQADTRDHLLGSLLPPADQARLKAYADRLAELTAAAPPDADLSLVDLLVPLFGLARQRSADSDAAAENRAALVVLGLHVNGRRLASLVPAARGWAQPRWVRITLHGRDDFPQHFVLSALLAAEGSSPLADAVGVYKEVADARGGSGFSFNDIAADRAGTRFGELAVQQPARLQAALAGLRDEHGLMPDVSDLPEFLPEAEFRRRYGGVGAPAYQRMLAQIEARIAATPLLR